MSSPTRADLRAQSSGLVSAYESLPADVKASSAARPKIFRQFGDQVKAARAAGRLDECEVSNRYIWPSIATAEEEARCRRSRLLKRSAVVVFLIAFVVLGIVGIVYRNRTSTVFSVASGAVAFIFALSLWSDNQ